MEEKIEEVEQAKHWFLDKTSRDGRTLFLDEWRAFVEPQQKFQQAMIDRSVTYGSTGVQAMYILNGGALAALPALAKGLIDIREAGVIAALFTFGIAMASVSSLSAYLNFQWNAHNSAYDALESSDAVVRRYGFTGTDFDHSVERKKLIKKINYSLYSGVAGASLSMIAFICGCILFLSHVL